MQWLPMHHATFLTFGLPQLSFYMYVHVTIDVWRGKQGADDCAVGLWQQALARATATKGGASHLLIV